MRTLVILPTFNEALNIETVVRGIRSAVPEVSILVVDDGSPDGTADIAEQLAEELGSIEVMRRDGKQGLGSAYRAGFRHGIDAGFDAMVEMDSDLQHDPEALPYLLAAAADGASLTIGSRYIPGGSIPDWAWHRRMLSIWGNRYASAMLGLGVRDATSGYRVYRAEVLRKIDLDAVRADGYGFQIEMAYQVERAGGRVVEVPIQFSERQLGDSKMSSRIVVEALVLVTWWAVRDRVFRRR
ncbi:MAG: polyprenol monophosphomannose synthase [Acidimicrobiales bacterium]|nr:polyprenol monophosphomannose synthase [Acidimicrobiales bacterium]